ncbi:hypothetical protein GCM10027402_20440 [Arthrobacter monumenti]
MGKSSISGFADAEAAAAAEGLEEGEETCVGSVMEGAALLDVVSGSGGDASLPAGPAHPETRIAAVKVVTSPTALALPLASPENTGAPCARVAVAVMGPF